MKCRPREQYMNILNELCYGNWIGKYFDLTKFHLTIYFIIIGKDFTWM